MFSALLQVLGAGLSLWADKEKHKYIDRLMDLKKRYYEEINKDVSIRDDAVLDNLEFELRTLGIAFSSSVGKQDTKN